MDIETLPDARAVAERAAQLVLERLRAAPEAVVLLPAGATPVPLYGELARLAEAGLWDPRPVHWMQLDELQGVAATDPRSFHAFLEQHVARPLQVGQRLWRIDGRAPGPREVERHAGVLARLGGAQLALLGLGANGHVAFNEPGSRADDGTRVVRLAPETRAGLARDFPEGPPTHGLTLGLREIRAAREILLLVTGASKAPALARLARRAAQEDFPASWLLDHPRFRVLADETASSGL